MNRARVSIAFERREEALAFAAQHGGTVLDAAWRTKWWVQLDLDLRDRDFGRVYQRVEAYGGEGHRVRFWPTSAFDRPLREQVDVLFAHHAASPIHIGFFLTGMGWASVVVATPATTLEHRASDYADDSLGELASLGVAVLRGAPSATMSFWDEPGELRVSVHGEGDEVVIELRTSLGGTYGGSRAKEPELQLTTRCARRELGLAIVRCLDDVLERYGVEGYAALWRLTSFPSELHATLRRALDEAG